jgi:MFS family permease
MLRLFSSHPSSHLIPNVNQSPSTLIGPAFGPLIGGVIVTYKSWRVIFWLQSAVSALATVMVFFLLPETAYEIMSLKGLDKKTYAKTLWQKSNPMTVVRLYRYPPLLIVASIPPHPAPSAPFGSMRNGPNPN